MPHVGAGSRGTLGKGSSPGNHFQGEIKMSTEKGPWAVAHTHDAEEIKGLQELIPVVVQGPAALQGIPGPDGPPGSIEKAWPVYSVFFLTADIDPGKLLEFGTWKLVGTGKILKITVNMWERTA